MSVTNVEPQPHRREHRSGERKVEFLLGAAVVLMGLLAGLFYAFACAVMPALGDSSDRTFVEAMQQINTAIENPVFFASFLGAPALAIWALVIERRAGSAGVARWIVAALALYTVGFLITSAFNIPLNDDLKQAGDPRHIADLAHVRDQFEAPWVAWNIVRTLATTAAFGCLAHALRLRARADGTTRSGPGLAR
jgi:uncharacterized membrane protein